MNYSLALMSNRKRRFSVKNTIKLIGIITVASIIGLSFVSCSDGGGSSDGGGNGSDPEFYAVHYIISDATHAVLESDHTSFYFSKETLAFVIAQSGNAKQAEKRGDASDVITFLINYNSIIKLSRQPFPTLEQLNYASVGAIAGWWPADITPKSFIYLERSK